MNSAIEIHDSTLQRIEVIGDEVVATFDAYVHCSPGRPGRDHGTGWSQLVQLRFAGGQTSGSVDDTPMDLLGGRLVLSGAVYRNLIPIPLVHVGLSRLELESWNEVRVAIEGQGVSCQQSGPAVYVEEFEPRLAAEPAAAPDGGCSSGNEG